MEVDTATRWATAGRSNRSVVLLVILVFAIACDVVAQSASARPLQPQPDSNTFAGPPTDPSAKYEYDPVTGATYACAPPLDKDVKPPPVPDFVRKFRQDELPHSNCKDGEVAWPKPDYSPKGPPPPVDESELNDSGADATAQVGETLTPAQGSGLNDSGSEAAAQAAFATCPLQPDSYFHCWATERRDYSAGDGTFAIWGIQTQHQPFMSDNTSLSQLWGILPTPGGYSTIELGWRVATDPAINDGLPHLFAYRFANGQGQCYDGCGFVPYGGPPLGSVVQPNSIGVGYTYGVQLNGVGWWLNYNGNWLGYYPPSAWPTWFPSYVTRVDAGGEVIATGGWPGSWMGNGFFGTNSAQSAMWHYLWRTRQPYSAPVSEYVVPSFVGSTPAGAWCAYQAGATASGYGQFHYGGPGYSYC